MPESSILPYKGVYPQIAAGVFLAPGSYVIGDVHIGSQSSLWFNAVVRGDVNYIRIGSQTNIQDNAVVHVDHKKHPTIIGDQVTVGHNAVVHACEIGDLALIGMGAIILDGARIPKESLVAAGAVVPPEKTYPPGYLILGSPAQAVRPLREEERLFLQWSAVHYVQVAQQYM